MIYYKWNEIKLYKFRSTINILTRELLLTLSSPVMPFGIILLILSFICYNFGGHMKDRIKSMMSHGITGLERVNIQQKGRCTNRDSGHRWNLKIFYLPSPHCTRATLNQTVLPSMIWSCYTAGTYASPLLNYSTALKKNTLTNFTFAAALIG
jgi:hypothetical protein